jgi:hypothetical protein
MNPANLLTRGHRKEVANRLNDFQNLDTRRAMGENYLVDGFVSKEAGNE